MKRFAFALTLAAKKREDSWSDFSSKYTRRLCYCCKKAVEEVGLEPEAIEAINMLLAHSWKDSLLWAAKVLK